MVVSVKMFGLKDDGERDLIGMAPGADELLKFSHALNEHLDGYPRALITDDAPIPNGLPIWTVYDHPRDWPDWYVARLWIGDHRTGNVLLYRDITKLRDELARRGLTPLMRDPTDDSVIMETWL